jgi:septum formation protein
MAIHPLPLILASSSESRKILLSKTKLTFTIIPSNIDETAVTGKNPHERIIKLAQAKAMAVSQKIDYPALILAADTFVIFNRKIVEKPRYKMDAVAMLNTLSDNIHAVVTGWAILNTYKNTWQTGASDAYVTFRKLSEKEIIDYVNDNPVTQWAAGYNSHLSEADIFISYVKGSLTGLNGLPLDQIIPALKKEWAHPYKTKLKEK